MRRREFITLLGSGAMAWPLTARAQQPEQMRRIGVLMNATADDPYGQARLAAFKQVLQQLGWTDGGNMRIDTRWGEDDVERARRYATELLALGPDVILASGTLSVAPLQRSSRTLPIVFVGVVDPVGGGIVDNLARPGGNATGFLVFEYSLGAKWLDLLRQIAPSVTRVAVVRNAANPAGIAEFGAIQNAVQSLGVEVSPVNVRAPDQIERDIAAFARSPNGGLIVTQSASATIYRALIIAVVGRYKLPAVYGLRYDVAGGGLISYGADIVDQFRQAATYVDRILKGAKPADLPVQAPTKYQLTINLKTAKALGLTVPDKLLGIADEVIE